MYLWPWPVVFKAASSTLTNLLTTSSQALTQTYRPTDSRAETEPCSPLSWTSLQLCLMHTQTQTGTTGHISGQRLPFLTKKKKKGEHAFQGFAQEETVIYDSVWLLTSSSSRPLLCCKLRDQTDPARHTTLLPLHGRTTFVMPKHTARNTSGPTLPYTVNCNVFIMFTTFPVIIL